jgi:hypothetical protein
MAASRAHWQSREGISMTKASAVNIVSLNGIEMFYRVIGEGEPLV